MRKSKWPRWGSGKTSSGTKFDKLKKVRRQTDQILKQQKARKKAGDAAEKNNKSPVVVAMRPTEAALSSDRRSRPRATRSSKGESAR